MYKIKKSKKSMYNTLRLLNKKPSKDASPEWLKNELFKIIEEPGSRGKIGIKDFIKVSKDPKAELKLFVLDCIAENEIIKTEKGYRIKEFDRYLGRYIEDAVDFFSVKDPEVIELKQILETRLKG